MNKLNEFCEWEDCDQEPVYCEGHAHELVNPLGLNIRGQQTEVERLTAERDDWAAVSEMKDSQIAWLQARVERLEADVAECSNPCGEYYFGLRCGLEDRDITDLYEAAEYGWEQAFEYVDSILAATEQEGE